MLSYEEEKPTDNLLQLWIAFEFLCSKERVPEIVKRETIGITIDALKAIDIPEKEKKELLQSISEVNNPPLMVKWHFLLEKTKIKLSESEEEIIRKLRSDRNSIIHGDEVSDLTKEEVEKFRSILEKVLIEKIIRLE